MISLLPDEDDMDLLMKRGDGFVKLAFSAPDGTMAHLPDGALIVESDGSISAVNPNRELEEKVKHLTAMLADYRNRIDALEFMLSEVRIACPKITPGRLATDKQPDLDCDNCNLW